MYVVNWVKSVGFLSLEIGPAGVGMEAVWVLGCALDVGWLFVGYIEVVVDIGGSLKSWLGGRRRNWYILEGCQQVLCSPWMHVVGHI